MIRTLVIASVVVLAAPLAAAAQTSAPMEAPRAHARQVEANGRCAGLSYGTGARRCGTRTGGPVGGISGRN